MAGGISRGFGGRRKSLVFDEFAYRTSEKQSQQADGTGLEFRRKVGADDKWGALEPPAGQLQEWPRREGGNILLRMETVPAEGSGPQRASHHVQL